MDAKHGRILQINYKHLSTKAYDEFPTLYSLSELHKKKFVKYEENQATSDIFKRRKNKLIGHIHKQNNCGIDRGSLEWNS